MILVTGGTGFIGQVLIRHLVSQGKSVRMLLRPSSHSPNLPRGVPVEVAVCSLKDERGLRAAMKGVEVVYHLAGAESRGNRGDLLNVDIRGTQAVAQACGEAGIDRLITLSHLGADRASAFPVFKAKAIAEHAVRQSGVDYTIFRSGVVYGPMDEFTTGLSALLSGIPFLFLLPGDGSILLQPLWVEDLVTCLTWSLDEPATRNQVISVGGEEALTFREITTTVMQVIGIRRQLVPISPAYLRILTVIAEHAFRGLPVSVFWVDYLAANRTCALDTIPRTFGFLPARFSQRLDHLRGRSWRKSMARLLLRDRRGYRT
jgi:NADH dehydrogenase